MRVLAIDIGGTKTAAALMNDEQFLERTSWPSPPTAEHAIDQIVTTCERWADQAQAAGVSFGGPFDFATQTCVRSMHVPGWDGVELSVSLERALNLPTVTDNDANVAALGEYANAARPRDPMLYVTVSTGVGAAIIVNGHLLRGAHSLAGELGHLPIGHDKTCNCGQVGCLERAVSGFWIEHDFGISAVDYLRDERNHEKWIGSLAHGLWSATMLVDPALIVLGGGMTSQGERLIEPLRATIATKASESKRLPPEVKLGDPSGRTVLTGAAIMAGEAFGGSR